MASVPSKLYTDDVSLVVVLLDTNPFFWGATTFPFSEFLRHVLAFLNSILLLNQLNQVVVIATGLSSCDYVFDSSAPSKVEGLESGRMPVLYSRVLQRLEEFVGSDERSVRSNGGRRRGGTLAVVGVVGLLDIQRVFRSGALHPQPRGSPDGPEQYVAVMNAIFSAQRSMVPIDSCVIGAQHSAFLQQASYITGGVYLKPPKLDGLFQYLSTIFATDLHCRSFLQLPKPVGVDFRASSVFGQANPETTATTTDRKRKALEV
ncbi:hypothetical protein Sjap_021527 [Stephania japonica]|uniref:General transcription and DNA repair factor IIH subunit TFB4 n=1 Tax=Stephania japonica TaxID=461633 RepID=A0AAP0HU72_9MAGN